MISAKEKLLLANLIEEERLLRRKDGYWLKQLRRRVAAVVERRLPNDNRSSDTKLVMITATEYYCSLII
ncbi:hypothetical protein D5086_025520 [Populus alba]|uniref:Uncharacterized protein n=1 Tax=Populus alba TaxID=43335 RepID=A0ACC4AZD8_POPAL